MLIPMFPNPRSFNRNQNSKEFFLYGPQHLMKDANEMINHIKKMDPYPEILLVPGAAAVPVATFVSKSLDIPVKHIESCESLDFRVKLYLESKNVVVVFSTFRLTSLSRSILDFLKTNQIEYKKLALFDCEKSRNEALDFLVHQYLDKFSKGKPVKFFWEAGFYNSGRS